MNKINFKKFLPGNILTGETENKVHLAIINLLSYILSQVNDDLEILLLQLCITTATGEWLEAWGSWFGITRQPNESDEELSKRILAVVTTPKITIPALKKALKEYLNEKYKADYKEDQIVIFEPYNNILRFSSKSGLFSCTRFRYADSTYYRYGVIDIHSPREIDNNMRDIIEKIKAAGIKVHYTVVDNLVYGVPVKMYSENEPLFEQYLMWKENSVCRQTLGAKIFSGYSYTLKNLFSGFISKTSSTLDYILAGHHFNLNWIFPNSPILKLLDIDEKERLTKEVVKTQYQAHSETSIILDNRTEYATDDLGNTSYCVNILEFLSNTLQDTDLEVSIDLQRLQECNNFNLDWFNADSPIVRVIDLNDNENLSIVDINKVQSQSACNIYMEKDDTEQDLQDIIDKGGTEIEIPAKTYNISNKLVLKSAVYTGVKGKSKLSITPDFKADATQPENEFAIYNKNFSVEPNSNADDITIKNIDFILQDINDSVSISTLLGFANTKQVTLENCNILVQNSKNLGQCGFDFYSANKNITLKNCNIEINTMAEIGGNWIRNASETYTDNSIVESVTITDCTFKTSSHDEALAIYGWKNSIKNVSVTNSKFIQNDTSVNQDLLVSIFGSDLSPDENTNGSIENVTFDNNYFEVYKNNNYIIQVGNESSTGKVDTISIVNNTFNIHCKNNAAIRSYDYCTNVKVENCIFNYSDVLESNMILYNINKAIGNTFNIGDCKVICIGTTEVADGNICESGINTTFVHDCKNISNNIVSCSKFCDFYELEGDVLIDSNTVTLVNKNNTAITASNNSELENRNLNINIIDNTFDLSSKNLLAWTNNDNVKFSFTKNIVLNAIDNIIVEPGTSVILDSGNSKNGVIQPLNTKTEIVLDVLSISEDGLSPLVNDGKTDNTQMLQNIIDKYSAENVSINLNFPNTGEYYFKNKIYIDNNKFSLSLTGNQSIITVAKKSSYNALFYILNINRLKVDNLIFTSTDNKTINNRGYIEVENADTIILENTQFNNADTGFKINFKNTDVIDEQNTVKHLITNDISADNVTCFLHICNIEKWDADTLVANIKDNSTSSKSKHVCFYLRPRSNNITVNNLIVNNCPGDVFHFNRFDYANKLGAYPPLGTEGFEDNNIVINHVIANNIGNLVGFNSETNDVSFKDVHVTNQKLSSGGIVKRFEGICNSVSIEGFEFKDIYKILSIEETENRIGSITIKNGTVSGEYKGDQSCNGKVESLTLDNITFNEIDSDIIGSVGFMFYGDWNSIDMSNLTFNLGNKATRNTEVIRFGDLFKGIVHLNNCSVFKENYDNYDLNFISLIHDADKPIDASSKFYINNLKRYNLDDIYYAEGNDENYIEVDDNSYNLFAGTKTKIHDSTLGKSFFSSEENTLTITSLKEAAWVCSDYSIYLKEGIYTLSYTSDNNLIIPDYCYNDEEIGVNINSNNIAIAISKEKAGMYRFRFFATNEEVKDANNSVVYKNIFLKAASNLFIGSNVKGYADSEVTYDSETNTLIVKGLETGAWIWSEYNIFLPKGFYKINYTSSDSNMLIDYRTGDSSEATDIRHNDIITVNKDANYTIRFFVTKDEETIRTVTYKDISMSIAENLFIASNVEQGNNCTVITTDSTSTVQVSSTGRYNWTRAIYRIYLYPGDYIMNYTASKSNYIIDCFADTDAEDDPTVDIYSGKKFTISKEDYFNFRFFASLDVAIKQSITYSNISLQKL